MYKRAKLKIPEANIKKKHDMVSGEFERRGKNALQGKV